MAEKLDPQQTVDYKELLLATMIETQTLAEIYDQYSPGLYRYAMRLLGDVQLAEDCVAETFSRFLRVLHAGGGPREYLQAYLYRVAHNWITDQYRRTNPPQISLDQAFSLDDGTDTLLTVEPGSVKGSAALDGAVN